MDKDSSGMLKVIIIRVNGRMIKPMVMECICIRMEPSMKECGRMIYRMEKGLRYGKMVVIILGYIRKERNMDMETIIGVMVVFIKGSGTRIGLVVMESIHGKMEGSM